MSSSHSSSTYSKEYPPDQIELLGCNSPGISTLKSNGGVTSPIQSTINHEDLQLHSLDLECTPSSSLRMNHDVNYKDESPTVYPPRSKVGSFDGRHLSSHHVEGVLAENFVSDEGNTGGNDRLFTPASLRVVESGESLSTAGL